MSPAAQPDLPTPSHEPTSLFTERYRLDGLLGAGGSAHVHRGYDQRLQRWVAVKILPAVDDHDAVALLQRRREVQTLAAVQHHGLVTLFDAIAADDATYLVMELLTGGTLQDRLAHGPLDPAELSRVGADLADALQHVHDHGIVHRDVKPSNVLLAGDDPAAPLHVKLSDFGIAKLLESTSSLTTGVVGTARYLSPEQAAGHPVGAASDVYSLGLTLIEAGSGQAAFPGSAVESLTARLLRDPDPPHHLGYRWRSLLTAMTARDPAARPTAAEVAERIRRIEDQPPGSTPTAPVTTVPLEPRTASHPDPPPAASTAAPPLRRRSRLFRAVTATGLAVGVTAALTAPAGLPHRAPTPASTVQRPGSSPQSPRATSAPTASRSAATDSPATGPVATAPSTQAPQRAAEAAPADRPSRTAPARPDPNHQPGHHDAPNAAANAVRHHGAHHGHTAAGGKQR